MAWRLVTVWWTALVVAVPVVLGATWGAGGATTPATVAVAAVVTATVGVLPAHVLGSCLLAAGSRQVPGPTAHLVAAVCWSAVMSLGVSALLFGLPHGWYTALSWHDTGVRTAWIAGVLVPVHLVTVLIGGVRAGRATGFGKPPRTGGRHL